MNNINKIAGKPEGFLGELKLLNWSLASELFIMALILEKIKGKVAIEIGTHAGGTLEVIAPRIEKAYSIDINPEVSKNLSSKFSNVKFLTGSSTELLPKLIQDISGKGEILEFVFIDGDHSAEGVRADINAVLQYVPTKPVYILAHDSFNPPCRDGILTADWDKCPYVHYVDVDFLGGQYKFVTDSATAGDCNMFKGLTLAIMLPEKRKGNLDIIQTSGQGHFLLSIFSCHHIEVINKHWKNWFLRSFISISMKVLRRLFRRKLNYFY